jgi:hypothetical protein
LRAVARPEHYIRDEQLVRNRGTEFQPSLGATVGKIAASLGFGKLYDKRKQSTQNRQYYEPGTDYLMLACTEPPAYFDKQTPFEIPYEEVTEGCSKTPAHVVFYNKADDSFWYIHEKILLQPGGVVIVCQPLLTLMETDDAANERVAVPLGDGVADHVRRQLGWLPPLLVVEIPPADEPLAEIPPAISAIYMERQTMVIVGMACVSVILGVILAVLLSK